MKRIPSILILALLLPVLAFATNTDTEKEAKSNETKAQAMEWSIDRAHSAVSFSIRHIFTPVRGEFTEYESEIYFDPNNLEESSVSVTIPISSIDTDNQKRDGHLQSPDFFNAEEYPTISFTADEFRKTGNNEFVAVGELTIKDVTKTYEMPFNLLGMSDHPMKEGAKIASIQIQDQLLRNDFNVGTGSWAETAVVGNEVDLNITLEMINE